jgi:hypothetical protein
VLAHPFTPEPKAQRQTDMPSRHRFEKPIHNVKEVQARTPAIPLLLAAELMIRHHWM